MRNLAKENMREKPFVKDPEQLQNLFKNFGISYYNFEYFKALQLDKFKEEFVQISVQAQKQAELIDMITKV